MSTTVDLYLSYPLPTDCTPAKEDRGSYEGHLVYREHIKLRVEVAWCPSSLMYLDPLVFEEPNVAAPQ